MLEVNATLRYYLRPKTYADAHRIDPDLYRFTRSLDSLDKLVTGNTSLILRTDSEPFSMLQSKEK